MKILVIGKNYVNNLEEIKDIITGKQMIFSKPESSLVFNIEDAIIPEFTK